MDRSIKDQSAYVNQAISAPYEPGSIFKIITFAAALEEGVVRRGDRLDCGNGQMTIGRRVIRDTHAYGLLPMEEAFAKSSNVGAIRLAQRMGRETFYTYIEKFGFGKRTEIDLPGEAVGILRRPDRWNPDSIGSIAMGQEIAVTPLQAVAAVAVIANGGRWVRPHLVERVTSFDERETLYRPERIERQILRPETAAQMTRLMEGVITEGTGRQAIQFDGFTVAGKTGTPQKWSEKGGYKAGLYMPSFLGFVPATKPRFAIVVTIDEPSAGAYYGGVVAAPLFAQLAEVALGDHEVQPDDPRYQEVIDRLARLGPARPSTRPITEGEDQPSQTSALPPMAHSRSSLSASAPRPRSEARPVVVPPAESRQTYAGGSRLSQPGQNQPVRESKDSNKLTADRGRGLPGSTRPRAGGPRGPVQLMPDLRGSGMLAATEACLNLHLEVRMRGRGARAVSQTPLPGTPVRPGDLCQITFE
jgi:membrane peptidoglycan carboxypeptidase